MVLKNDYFQVFEFQICCVYLSNRKYVCYWYNPKYYESRTIYFHTFHIGSRLFELFSKEVRLNKQPGMSLNTENFDALKRYVRTLGTRVKRHGKVKRL